MEAGPGGVGAVLLWLCDPAPDAGPEIVGVIVHLLCGHHVLFLLTQTLTIRGIIPRSVLGVRRVAQPRVTGVHQVREAARRKGLVGLRRRTGNRPADVL